MSLNTLPTELVHEICNYLGDQELYAIRSTCHSLCTKSSKLFGARHFNKVGILVTQDSLDSLEELAASESIPAQVHELWVIPNMFKGPGNYDFDREDFGPNRRTMVARSKIYSPEYYEQYQGEVADHYRLLESQVLKDTLTRCISKFENLDTIGLCSIDTSWRLLPRRSFEAFRCLRLRDLKSRLTWAHDRRPCFHRHDGHFKEATGRDNSLVLSALLDAVVACSRSLKAIYTCEHSHAMKNISKKSFNFSQATMDLVKPLVKDLEVLHFCDPEDTCDPEQTSSDLLKEIMIEAAPALKSLKLDEDSLHVPYVFWKMHPKEIFGPGFWDSVIPHMKFERLMELHLSCLVISQSSFLKVLNRAAPTLRILKLIGLDLRGEGVSLSSSKQGLNFADFEWTKSIEEEMRQAWKHVFATIRDRLSLQHLSSHNAMYCEQPVHFTNRLGSYGKKRYKPNKVIYDESYSTVSVNEWIDNLDIRPYEKVPWMIYFNELLEIEFTRRVVS